MCVICPFHYSKYIILSSSLVFCPIYISYYKKIYLHTLLLSLTWFFSVNYWRNATYSWRRNVDLIWAKIIFIFYLINGTYYITDKLNKFLFFQNILLMGACYNESCKHHNEWIKYHMLFHCFSIINLNMVMLHLKN